MISPWNSSLVMRMNSSCAFHSLTSSSNYTKALPGTKSANRSFTSRIIAL